MNDQEWCKKIEGEIIDLKKRVDKLESNSSCSDEQKVLEGDIEWPEAVFGGLHFNSQKTHAVFELKEDGKYYSRDILFNSARDTDKGTGRDLLTEYLESEAVKEAIQNAFNLDEKVSVFIPEENQGVKKYNGVDWLYWLKPRSGSSAIFTIVNSIGTSNYYNDASAVGGCAPAFCVGAKQRHN
ncbi:hypothetical protein [Treponema sp. R6D11]